jgi:hypothetical protein
MAVSCLLLPNSVGLSLHPEFASTRVVLVKIMDLKPTFTSFQQPSFNERVSDVSRGVNKAKGPDDRRRNKSIREVPIAPHQERDVRAERDGWRVPDVEGRGRLKDLRVVEQRIIQLRPHRPVL